MEITPGTHKTEQAEQAMGKEHSHSGAIRKLQDFVIYIFIIF